MFRNVFLKSLRDQYRGLIGWGIGLAVLVILIVALWPSVRDMPDLEEFIASYPEAMRKVFNLETITTASGFLNAELYSIMLPALFLVFGIGRGARAVAGEEHAGSLEVLLTTPMSRPRILLDKAAALAVSVLVLGAVLFLTSIVSTALVGADIPLDHLATASLAMALLGIEHGWLALAVGAATARRSLAIAVAGTVAAAGYVVYVMASFVEALEPFAPASPFHQALEGGPIGAGLPGAYGWMVLGAVAVLAASLPLFDRRDVATA